MGRNRRWLERDLLENGWVRLVGGVVRRLSLGECVRGKEEKGRLGKTRMG